MRKLIVLSILLTALLGGLWWSFPPVTAAAPEWQTFAPPTWILGPIQGADGTEADILTNLNTLDQWKIPITAFHFDSPDWQKCPGNAKFRYSDNVLNKMRSHHIRGLFWIVPLIDLRCSQYSFARANDYFVKDSQGNVIVTNNFVGNGSWIDFNNPAAVAYWHTLLDGLRNRTGNLLGGFYTDSVRPDNPPDGVDYAEKYAADLLAYTRANIPDGDVIFKRYGKFSPSDTWLNANAHTAYVNDLPTSFGGMQEGIRRVFDTTAFMPLAYNEFSGFGKNSPDAETYIRRMHWGAFQPLMENVPKGAQPWDARYPSSVMQAYRYYANLHWELQPYLHSYDQAAFEDTTHTTNIFRNADKTQYSAQLGNEFFVQFVTSSTKWVDITLPAGEWINYWNESQIFTGGTTISYKTPLGKEPIFIRRGAIIPMQVRNTITGHGTANSAGALTVNVYPLGHSTFNYHDAVHNWWLTFDVTTADNRMALCTLNHAPSQPIIWRIAGVTTKPNSVTVQSGAVGINTAWGNNVPSRSNEAAVGAKANGWFYDAAATRLIVKISNMNLGTNCPAP